MRLRKKVVTFEVLYFFHLKSFFNSKKTICCNQLLPRSNIMMIVTGRKRPVNHKVMVVNCLRLTCLIGTVLRPGLLHLGSTLSKYIFKNEKKQFTEILSCTHCKFSLFNFRKWKIISSIVQTYYVPYNKN